MLAWGRMAHAMIYINTCYTYYNAYGAYDKTHDTCYDTYGKYYDTYYTCHSEYLYSTHTTSRLYVYIYILYEYMAAFARMCACVSVSSCLSTRVCIYTHFACCMCRACMQVCEAMYGYICMCMHSTILGASAERIHVYFIASHIRSLFTFRPRTTLNAYMSLFA